MWCLKKQPGESSLTEGGADAAINVLDPVDLVQGLRCSLGKIVLQDDTQRVSGWAPHPPHPYQLLRSRELGILDVAYVDGSHEKGTQNLQLWT